MKPGYLQPSNLRGNCRGKTEYRKIPHCFIYCCGCCNGHGAAADCSGGRRDGYATEPLRTGEAIVSVASSASVLYYEDIVTYADNQSEPIQIIARPVPCFKEGRKMVMQRGAGFCTVKSTPDRENAACADTGQVRRSRRYWMARYVRNAGKSLSVWFEDDQTGRTEDLKKQMAEKDKQLQEIGKYHFSRIPGERGIILIDEKNRVFTAIANVPEKRMVRSVRDVMDLRPDIISFDQIRDIGIGIKESIREEKKTVNGKQVSYVPPHMVYMYTYTVRIMAAHPYIWQVAVPMERSPVQIRNPGRRKASDGKIKVMCLIYPQKQSAAYEKQDYSECTYHNPYEMPGILHGFRCTMENWDEIQKYAYYLNMARAIMQCLTGSVPAIMP